MKILVRLIISAIAVLVTDLLLPGVSLGDMSETNGLLTALLVAAVLGLLNALLKPVLILLTLPVTVVTLGLFLLVINAGMLKLTAWLAQQLDIGFYVDDFWPAVGGAIIITLTTWVVDAVIGSDEK